MMTKHIRRAAQRGEAGFAMLTVLFAILILTLLGSVLLANAISALPQARHAQDFNAALAAAEAGIDDYLARLAQNYTYATDPPDGNLALTGYVAISPGSKSSFTYSVDTTQLDATGQFTLTVHGRVGAANRTVKVGLRPYGFLDALSLTDYNLVDPTLVGGSADCVYKNWEANPWGYKGPRTGKKCGNLFNYWITGNTLRGPMQSNDDFYLCGSPKFTETVDSGDPDPAAAPYWVNPSGLACGGLPPQFDRGPPRGQRQVKFPPTSASIKAETTIGSPGKGCLFTGPTSIEITGTTMTVVSPDTIMTNPNCLGTNPLPANGVIYVQDIPVSPPLPALQDPNSGSCQITLTWVGDGAACGQGDAFVKGTLAGALTIAANNNIIVTGDLKYGDRNATSPRQVLGLVADNSVEINHPINGDGSNTAGTVTFPGVPPYTVPLINPRIQAAIVSLRHSFAVLNFAKGSPAGLGAVELFGSVAGKFMDIEGEFGDGGALLHGYDVDYTYDSRLLNGGLTPPKFLEAEKTFWHRVSFTDCGNGSSTSTTASC